MDRRSMTTLLCAAACCAAPSAAIGQIEFTRDFRSYGAQVRRIWFSPDGSDIIDEIVDEVFFFPNGIDDFAPIDDTIELLQSEPDGQFWLSRVTHASSFTATSLTGETSYRLETGQDNETCVSDQDGTLEIYQDIESNYSARFEVSQPCRVRISASLSNATDDAEVEIRLVGLNGLANPVPLVVVSTGTATTFDREVYLGELGEYTWSARSDIRLFCAAPGTVSTGDWTTNFELLPDCNAADYAEPHGVLDLADLQDFIGFFAAGAPEADLAEPLGVFDLGDLSSFVESFNAGCP